MCYHNERILITTIYSDNNPQGMRSIWITLYNGNLNMNSQDVSPELEGKFGRDTYERFVSGINSENLKDFLNVKEKFYNLDVNLGSRHIPDYSLCLASVKGDFCIRQYSSSA